MDSEHDRIRLVQAPRGDGIGWRCLVVLPAPAGAVAIWMAGPSGLSGAYMVTGLVPHWQPLAGHPQEAAGHAHPGA